MADWDEGEKNAVARTTVTVVTDDLDGSPAQGTVAFSLDGTSYEIDLNTAHASQLREALGVYIASARVVSTRNTKTRTPDTSIPQSGVYDPKDVRIWAREVGITVPARGRIPGAVLAQYRDALS